MLEVLGWCLNHGRSDLLFAPFIPDHRNPVAERLPIVECTRLRAAGAVLLCLEAGASPREVPRDGQALSALDLAGNERRGGLLHLIQSFEVRQSAVSALEPIVNPAATFLDAADSNGISGRVLCTCRWVVNCLLHH